MKIQYVIAIHLMRWLANFYDFRFKGKATAEIRIHPDCHSWWISKMQSGREDTLEKRYAIKFCFNLGKNVIGTYGMLQTALGPYCMNRVSVFEWHKRFKEDRESVRDDERRGRSKEVRTPELIGQIKNFMDKDRRVSIEIISVQFDVSVGTIHTIIHEELKMRKNCAKFVPRVLSEDEKERRFYDSGGWSSWSIQIPQFLILWWPAMNAGSTAMTKRQSSQWKHAGSRRPTANPPTNFWWSLFFLTALAWSTCTGQTVNKEYYIFKGVQEDSVRRGQHSLNRVSGISTRIIHQSTTPSLSQSIWPRWASR